MSLLLTLVLSACKTTSLVSDTTTRTVTDSTYIKKQDVAVTIPKDSSRFQAGKIVFVRDSIVLRDTVLYCPEAKIVPVNKKITNKKGDSANVIIDSKGNVEVDCITKEKNLIVEIGVLTRKIVIYEKNEKHFKEKLTGFGNLIENLKAAGILLVIVLLICFAFYIRKFIA